MKHMLTPLYLELALTLPDTNVYYRVDLTNLNSLGTAPIQICEILSVLLFNAHLELVMLCPPPHTHTVQLGTTYV